MLEGLVLGIPIGHEAILALRPPVPVAFVSFHQSKEGYKAGARVGTKYTMGSFRHGSSMRQADLWGKKPTNGARTLPEAPALTTRNTNATRSPWPYY